MDNIKLFFSLDGRIRRTLWWLGLLGVFIVTIGLVFLSAAFGLGPWGMFQPLDSQTAQSFADQTASLRWYGFALTLLLAYPYYAISIKRRQDHGSKGIDVKIFAGLALAMSLWGATGLGFIVQEIPLPRTDVVLKVQVPPMLYNTANALVGLFGLYLGIMLGFVRGTKGPNAYGEDTVRPKPAA